MGYLSLILLFAININAQPSPVTDLSASQFWRGCNLTWTAPITAATVYYQIRTSTYLIISTEEHWNIASTSYTYTTTSTLGSKHTFTISGLVNGITYSFAIKTSTVSIDIGYSGIDTTLPRPYATPTNNIPGFFSPIAPLRYSVVSKIINFDWSDSFDSDTLYGDKIKYDLFISLDPAFSTTISVLNLTTSYCSFNAENILKDNTTYYWRIRARDSENAARKPEWHKDETSFIYNGIPELPTLPSPITPLNIVVKTNTPKLQWTPSTDPDPKDIINYRVYLSSINEHSGFLLYITTTTNSYTTSELNENTTYWWYIIAVDSYSLTSQSTTSYFWVNSVEQSPTRFNLLSPSTGTHITSPVINFTWESSTDPDPKDVVVYILYMASTVALLDSPVPQRIVKESIPQSSTQYTETLQEDTTYYWKICAQDSTLKSAESYQYFYFVYDVINSTPTQFSLILSSGIINSFPINLQWQKSYDTDPFDTVKYILIYSPDKDFQTNIFSTTTITNSYQILNLPENSTFYWRVIAEDNKPQPARRYSNETFILVIDAEPEDPVDFPLVDPIGGKKVNYKNVLFTWGESFDPDPYDGIKKYELYYSTTPGSFNDPISLETTYYLTNLEPYLTYYWQVKAISLKTGEKLSYQNGRFITINLPPNEFNLLSPTKITFVSTPTFSWSPTADPENEAIKYELQITSTDFTTPLFVRPDIYTTYYVLPAPLGYNATYYWRIKAIDAKGGYTFSPTTSFFLQNYPPNTFSIIYPQNNSFISELTPKIVWEQTTDPENETINYKVLLSTNSDLSSPILDIIRNITYYELPFKLLNNTTYYLQVIAYTWKTDKTFTPIIKFITANQPPKIFSLLSPTDKSISRELPIKFKWEKTQEPENEPVVYEILILSNDSVIISTTTSINSYVVVSDVFIDNKEYNWHVTATDPHGNKISTTKNIFYFNPIAEHPSSPHLIAPADGSEVKGYFAFKWLPATDPDPLDVISYKLYYSSDQNFHSVYIINVGTNTKISLDYPLQPITKYYWKVCALDTYGLKSFSKVNTFFTSYSRPLPPDNLTFQISPTGDFVKIGWRHVEKNEDQTDLIDFKEYRIYRSRDLKTEFTYIGSTTTNSFVDRIDGVMFYYYIQTVSQLGITSEKSDILNISGEIVKNFHGGEVVLNLPHSQYDILNQQNLNITVEKLDDRVYNVKIVDNEGKTLGKNIEKGAILEIKERNIERKSNVFWHDGCQWINLGGDVDTENRIITVKIYNTGLYKVIFVEQQPELIIMGCSPEKRIITPNNDGKNDTIIFQIPQNVKITGKIYDVTGALVGECKNQDINRIYWDGRNFNGDILDPGIYIYQITTETGKLFNGTIVIAR